MGNHHPRRSSSTLDTLSGDYTHTYTKVHCVSFTHRYLQRTNTHPYPDSEPDTAALPACAHLYPSAFQYPLTAGELQPHPYPGESR